MNSLLNIVNRLPALPRFSDRTQRRAGGNIVKFLAMLLVLTFIARGTSGATLARVSVTNPERGEITQAVAGSATVSARDTLDIYAPEGLMIVELPTGIGQSVSIGDIVARFDIQEVSEKLIRETAKLDKMLLDIETLERAETTDSNALDGARRNMARVNEDYNNTITQINADIASANEALDEAINKLAEDPDAEALESALRSLKRAQEDYNSTKSQGEADVSAAQAELNEAQRAPVEFVDQTSIDSARRNRTRAQEDFNSIKAQGESDVSSAQAVLANAQNLEKAKYSEWESAADEDAAAVAWSSYLSAQADTAVAGAALAAAQKRFDDSHRNAQRMLEDAETSLYNT